VADQRVKDFAYQILEAQLANGMSGAQNPTQQFVAAVPTPASMQQPQVMSYSDIEPAFYEQRLPMEGRATFLPFRDTMEGSVFNERELAVPGILAELMNAFTAPARSMTDPTFNAGEEAANMALNVGGSGLAISRGMRAPTGQGGFDLAMNAYHGTPYEIKGGFDLSKVGTGEGAQAYGYGTYFSKDPNIASGYKTKLSNVEISVNGNPLSKFNVDPRVTTHSPFIFDKPLEYGLAEYTKALKTQILDYPELQKDIKFPKQLFDEKVEFLKSWGKGSKEESAGKALEQFAKENGYPQINMGGNLYKVDIPDEQIPRMLDWNKPFKQQTPEVQKAFTKLYTDKNIADDNLMQWFSTLDKDKASMSGLYNGLATSDNLKGAKDVSRLLLQEGVPGVKYLDSLSRGSEKGTQNFVSFDPTTVKILEKNDMPITE
jgi:hypothetical protein